MTKLVSYYYHYYYWLSKEDEDKIISNRFIRPEHFDLQNQFI